MCKVSIIIPVYNVEKYLKKCVDSVINQTYKNLEIILVDDGSPDNCPAICDDYARIDNRVKVIHKQNGGQGEARNYGIETAQGEYLLFVDSDDYIAHDTVEILVNKAKKYDVDMVVFDYLAVDDQQNIVYKSSSNFQKEKIYNSKTDKEIVVANPSPVTQLYKKSIFDDPEMRFASHVIYEDLRLMPKLFHKAKRIVYADSKPLYYYLQRSNSSMRNGNIEKTKSHRIMAIKDILDYFKEKNITNDYKEELDWICIFHGFFLPSREILHFDGDYSSAIKELYEEMSKYVSKPLKNKYLKTLTKKERLIFYCIYYGYYPILRFVLKNFKFK